jgi:hypothetical protein
VTAFSLQRYQKLFDRANEIQVSQQSVGPMATARSRLERIGTKDLGFSETECQRCGVLSFRTICECVFQELVTDYSKLTREERSRHSLPNEVLMRFTLPDWVLTDIALHMELALEGEWIHQGERESLQATIHHQALLDYDKRSDGIFGPDLKFAEDALFLPPIDPYPGRDGLTTWQTIPLMLPVAAFFIDTVDDALKKKQREARHPAWKPEPIYEFLARKRKDSAEQLLYLARFFVELALDEAGQSLDPQVWAASVGNRWQPLGPLPSLPTGEISPQQAEEHVERLIRYFGDGGSKVTRFSQDGGFDVVSNHLAVQVKHQLAPVGPQVVREIFGVAMSLSKRAAVFSRGTFTKSARAFANENQIILFQYFPVLEAQSDAATRVLQDGLLAELGL